MESTSSELAWLDLSEASQLIRQRAVSPVELTWSLLERIQRLNKKLNAFITVTAESAMQEACQAEKDIAKGQWRGPLHGIPIALKDNIEVAQVRTTAGSAVLQNHIPANDAAVVQRLREAGAVLLGKLNLHEFAYGASSIISHFGVVRNPWHPEYIAGGSSSGSAAAVAAGLCYASIGTDTGGSIRLPASHCGVVGLKPSYGLVSTRGIIPLSWTFDHVGLMTRTVNDNALVLQVIAGYEPENINSHRFPAANYTAATQETTTCLRLGVPREFFWEELDGEVLHAAEAALNLLSKFTASTREITLPMPADTIVFRCEPFISHQQHLAEHASQYHPETLRRIQTGADITAAEYVESHRKLRLLRREILRAFAEVDLLVTPTTLVLPSKIADLESSPQRLRSVELLMAGNTQPFNAFGLPAISV
ncbi:MAG TPA: amidase, partial [Candidatus Angelobacter sp.]